MKKILIILMVMTSVGVMAQNEWVNIFIGTNGMGHTFPGACYPYGSVQLSPDTDTIPHDINGVYQPRAYDYCAGYQYRDNTIVGFSHRHFSGTGHSDLGDILVMPYSSTTRLNPGTKDNPDGGYRQRYSKASEKAEPGYYTVLLTDDSIRCELTVTPYCGIHRYIFPKGKPQKIILDLNHGLYNYNGKTLWAQCNVQDKRHLSGSRLTSGWSRQNQLYYGIRFNKNIKNYGCKDFAPASYNGFWHRFDTEHNFPEMGGHQLVCYFEFENDGNDTLEIMVGLSACSASNALQNSNARLFYPTAARSKYSNPQDKSKYILTINHGDANYRDDFDVARKLAELQWQQRLSRIQVEGSDDQKAMFYTSLYHTLINPSLYQDEDGSYRGIDQEIYKNNPGSTNYTVFSVWDTYRAFHPLVTLLDTSLSRDIVTSFLDHYQQSPHHMLPVWSHMGSENWCMIGYHGVSVIVDAASKGIAEANEPGALKSILSTSNCDYYDYTGLYKQLGYVPVDKSGNGTSITLENAYEDWCVYRGLQLMECPWEDFDDSLAMEQYRQRALNYRNVIDTTIGFARGRLSDGSWKQPYSLLSTSGEGFIEGNSWNYSFYVPHDVNGLMRLMGGEKKFVAKLDTLFTMHIPDEFFAATEDVTREGMLGGYVQGNEPSHHIPYLYMWTSQPWKTQYWMREIMNRMYRNHIDGLCGNDDCGQMSAWYIFSAMGFYPVCPGSGEYVLGAPYLPYMKVTLGNGRTLEIKAPKVSDKNRYIQKVTWNGKEYAKAYVTHEMLMQGGTLEFTMGSRPNKKLFQADSLKPYSLSKK